ncbi:hypothetical protein PFISCL1PPCAC_9394 [Pristionchus fissidentatus]|uniref:tRNA-dihydrouridine synthase n=1 Tax=Pristionchus fissidentatus TaxID=1538716 RepID=A0AAV5VEG4_9BILA|nr:hypothetical protein PFISCL1PPCAC_9394 [Pristionchus fissidentatus]
MVSRLDQDEVEGESIGDSRPLYYCAPMVRYSKLPFRNLVRAHGVDVAYSPMIYARNFLESEHARVSEFATHKDDKQTIVQFAANEPEVLAAAAELVYPYSVGVDLNCGCPKSDVRQKGFGSSLLTQPELLADIVRQTRARISDPEYKVSLKIRVNYPLDRTIDLCRKAEAAGVSHLTVHGRTPWMRCEPVDYEAIRTIVDAVSVPVIANGDIRTLDDATKVAAHTGCAGIMAANGLLANPSLFDGGDTTSAQCVRDWLSISANLGVSQAVFHQHLVYMLRDSLTPQQRRLFNELSCRPAVEQFLEPLLRED